MVAPCVALVRVCGEQFPYNLRGLQTARSARVTPLVDEKHAKDGGHEREEHGEEATGDRDRCSDQNSCRTDGSERQEQS